MELVPETSEFVCYSPPQLTEWVEQVWYSCGPLDVLRERVLPAATTDIVANLGPAMRLAEGTGVERIVGTTVTGLLTRPIVLEHPLIHEAVGIRLTPHGLRAVLGVPAGAFRDLVVGLPDALESPLDELVDACQRVEGATNRLRAAIQWTSLRIERFAESGDALVRWATRQIDRVNGALSIARLQDRSGYGATSFNRRFVDELGVTPKHYARLNRFRAALDALAPDRSLCELALELGYTDQSHMNRDFRLFGDTTPTEVLARRYPSGITLSD